MSRWLCKDYLRGTCSNSFFEKWHPSESLFDKTKSGCRFGEKCAFAHRQVDEQPTKRSKTNNDKSAVAMLKNGNWQERICHRWMSRSNGEKRASTLKPEEREFVVDSGASMHMISKKDLSEAEMDTLTKSCSPTIVITANGEVQTQEEAIVYVKELDIFLTMKVLENTPAVLSLGKLRDENGYSYEWINGQKPHLIKDGIRIICNTQNFVPIVAPGLSSSSSASSSTSRTLLKQESPSSSSSPSSPTVDEISVREREDAPNSDISPVPVSELVDDGTGKPVETQANKKTKTNKKETTIERGNPCGDSEIP